MATAASNLQPPAGAINGSADPDTPVPLDTIPISPADENGTGENSSSVDVDGEGESEETTAGQDEASSSGGTAAAPSASAAAGTRREYGEDEQITVFHDANNFNVKHPLMHTWTLWFTKPPSGRVW